MLQGRKWKVAYCHEALQWGLVPDTFNAHVIQRTKWVSQNMSDKVHDVSSNRNTDGRQVSKLPKSQLGSELATS
jgi:hypothetical protein